MVTFSKYLLILLTLMLSFTSDSYGKKEAAKEIIIFPEQDYATTLNTPVAAMVLEYHSPNLIEEELIFEEGKTTPVIRIIKKGRNNHDTLLYSTTGEIIRLGKLRNSNVKERVEFFDEHHKYFFATHTPRGRSNLSVERIRLTDFDSQGNWRKASYYFDNKNAPVVTRTLFYTHSPEHIALLEKSKELYKEVEDHKTAYGTIEYFIVALSILGLIIALLCLRAKNLFSGKFRWIMVLIIGLQSATMFWFSVSLLIPEQPAWYHTVFSLVVMITYIVSMELAMKSMAYDRRLSNGFITFFLVIWSLWAGLLLCPMTLAALIPSIGVILGYILGLALAIFYCRYVIKRCPRCHNPFGLQYHHRSMEGLKTVTRTTQSTKYRDPHPQVMGLSQSGKYTHAILGVKGTRTTTTNTNVYETYRDHHKCWECGYITTSSLMRGKLVDSDSTTSTDHTKDIIEVKHWDE